jgi:quercetin dioxygenase-like cupin family protein
MGEFPAFMKRKADRIPGDQQNSAAVEGYVFDGADGAQMAFWTCHEEGGPAWHVHDFDEYMVVIEGEYHMLLDGSETVLRRGDEAVVPRGMRQSGWATAGTRTIHAFGGRRVKR